MSIAQVHLGEADIATLLTADGKGKEEKLRALNRLLSAAHLSGAPCYAPTSLPPSGHEKPTQPPAGLLASIAMRLDHSFGIPSMDWSTGQIETDEQFARRREVLLADAYRAWEEIAGYGFWSRANNESYESPSTQQG